MAAKTEQVKQVAEALRVRLAQAPPGTPCAVQAGKTLAYAEREMGSLDGSRTALRALQSAAAWVAAAESSRPKGA